MGNEAGITQASQAAGTQRSRPRLDLALLAILLLAAGLRGIGLGRPLVGNFATKNVVYGMIARNWAEGRSGLWYPTLDVLVGGSRSYHMLEWPAAAYLSGSLWRVLGGSLEMWGQGVAAVCSVAAVGLLFVFVRRRHGRTAGLAAAAALALSPVSVIYGQSFMLEASLVLFCVAAVDAWDRYFAAGQQLLPSPLAGEGLGVRGVSRKITKLCSGGCSNRPAWPALVAAGLATALLLVTKIYMLVLLLPLAWWWWRSPLRTGARLAAAAVLLAALAPAAAWYVHAYRTAAPGSETARHVYYSVRNSAEKNPWPHPLLGTAGFYRRMAHDLAGVALTPLGVALLVVGFWHPGARTYLPWLAACGLLILLLPRKFYDLNYYDMAVLPPLCILVGLGWDKLCGWWRLPRAAGLIVLGLAAALALRYAWGPVRRIADDDRAVVAAGRMIQSIAAPDEPVVALHGTTIDLLYYCHRPGWQLSPGAPDLAGQLDDCRRQGARYVVVADADPARFDQILRLAPLVLRQNFRIYELPPWKKDQ